MAAPICVVFLPNSATLMSELKSVAARIRNVQLETLGAHIVSVTFGHLTNSGFAHPTFVRPNFARSASVNAFLVFCDRYARPS
jgi:hypothetical protein